MISKNPLLHTLTAASKTKLMKELREHLQQQDPQRNLYSLHVTFTTPRNRSRHEHELHLFAHDFYKVLCEEIVAKRRYMNQSEICPRMIAVVETRTKNKNQAEPHLHCVIAIHRRTEAKFLPIVGENSIANFGRLPKLQPRKVRTSLITHNYIKDKKDALDYAMKNVETVEDCANIVMHSPMPLDEKLRRQVNLLRKKMNADQ
jgi:hypothetical protein